MKIKWYARQIIPTKYATAYRNAKTREPFFTTWWMWLGRSFKSKTTAI